jgi:hypothetical protein
MIFKHSDFKKAKGLPESLIREGLVRNYYFFYIEYGSVLNGPLPVIIKKQNNRNKSNFGELFINGDSKYWNCNEGFYESGYCLVFKTGEELENEKEFILR